ncbi:hypothetical protein E2C01_091906 [Portunus trituberculatus]|uniref:Uncharacterized protein n=1 Tax=Portunus trituberculatus TaxID=210409 RepID=A0A5B7JPY3_PORTR|nr:hypothetical protein [Portunus trituberculatus]
MRPSEELPEQETAVGGLCGGVSSFPLRPEDDVSRTRAETPLPKHTSLDTQPSSTGQPLLGETSSGWVRWSTGSLRRNHLVWPLSGDQNRDERKKKALCNVAAGGGEACS